MEFSGKNEFINEFISYNFYDIIKFMIFLGLSRRTGLG